MPANQIKYFEGKFVTIITGPCNRNFKEEAVAMGKPMLYPKNVLEHFTGIVIQATDKAIVLEHPMIKTRSYFLTSNIIGIIEEQVVNDPKLIEEAKAEIKDRDKDIKNFKCPVCDVSMKRPMEVEIGTDVMCPKCNASFKLPAVGETAQLSNPIEDNSPHVNLDTLTKLAKEAKDKNK